MECAYFARVIINLLTYKLMNLLNKTHPAKLKLQWSLSAKLNLNKINCLRLVLTIRVQKYYTDWK